MFPLIFVVTHLLLNFASSLNGSNYCHFEESEIFCTGTDLQTIIQTFYGEYPYMFDNRTNLQFIIEDSYIYSLDYFPDLRTDESRYVIRGLTIRNSSLSHVGRNAVNELEGIEYLDLSRNSLKNVLFAQHLPATLRTLKLSHNRIVYVDNVFNKLSLKYLDLSYNQINIIDLKNVYAIPTLDFSWNRIHNLVPHLESYIEHINLNHNQIKEYNEPELGIRMPNIDLSFNKLESVKLKCCIDKNYLDLSANVNLTHFQIEPQYSVIPPHDDVKLSINTLNVSYNSYNKILEKEIVVQDTIILRNNNFTYLNNSTINLKKIIPLSRIDISNSSVMDISEFYFSNMDLLSLNLSYNRLVILGSNIFQKSHIISLDLSHSQVKDISVTAFIGLVSEEVDLSYNNIEF